VFFFIPLGHDRSVYGYPWATITLIALCSIIWIVSFSAEQRATDGINEAGAVVQRVHANYPRARVTWEMRGLSPEVTGQLFSELMDPEHTEAVPGDEELDVAMRDLVAQLNRMPVLRYGYRPAAASVGTMFTSLFMHGGFFHLFGNMVFLFLTGSVIECFWGRLRFLTLYFVSGVLATLTFHAFYSDSYVPLVGASGAIAGLMGAFMVGHPKTRVRFGYIFWFFFVPKMGTFMVPAWGALLAWIVQQVVFAFVGLAGGGDGVAYWAHVGGFAVGAVAALMMKQFDLFPAYAKELLRDEEVKPRPLAATVAAQPLAKRRAAWINEAAPKPAADGNAPSPFAASTVGAASALGAASTVGAASALGAASTLSAAPRSSRGEVESIAIPGFEDVDVSRADDQASPFGADESFFDAEDDGISIPLAPPNDSAAAADSGLPDDIIPEGAMHASLPEADRYRGGGDVGIDLPGFDMGPQLPEPPGGFDDKS